MSVEKSLIDISLIYNRLNHQQTNTKSYATYIHSYQGENDNNKQQISHITCIRLKYNFELLWMISQIPRDFKKKKILKFNELLDSRMNESLKRNKLWTDTKYSITFERRKQYGLNNRWTDIISIKIVTWCGRDFRTKIIEN